MSDLNRSIKIYIDGSDASKGIEDVKNKISSLEEKLSGLNKTEANYAENSAKLAKEISAKKKVLTDYEKKVAETDRVLRNLSGATYNELQAVQAQVRKELRNAVPQTEKYNQILEQNRRVTQQLTIAQKEMRVEVGCQASTWGKAADFVNRYLALGATAITAITGFSLKLVRLAEDVAKMDDVYADVMKTTGLTRDEVLSLNEDFKKLDTRTSREELNKLAADAGKLGITGRENLLDFADAGNQIRVALGEDLGEDAIKNIGKITDVYKLSTSELEDLDLKGKMLAVGSSINQLGQSSTASESYLVDFTKRLGGVASQAGVSVQNILGYASALDQSGQAVEMSATAFQTFIMKLMENPAKFAKLAGENLKEFTTLLNEDTNAAIIKVLTSLNQKGGFQALIPIFKEMGMDGARAVGVLSSLASNINMVTDAQKISNEAFMEGTSITNEYQTKNNNLQAKLEKAQKAFRDKALEIGEKLNPALLRATNLSTQTFKAILSLISISVKYKSEIIVLTTTLAIYTVAIKLHHLWQMRVNDATKQRVVLAKLDLIQVRASIAAEYAFAAAKALLTGNIKLATTAMKSFLVTLGLNPYVAVGVAISAVAVGIYKLATNTRKATDYNTAYAKASEEAQKSVAKERTELDLYLSIAKNDKLSKEKRLEAIKKLNNISPEYLGNLTLESINTNAATKSIQTYIKYLEKSAIAKAAESKMTELYALKIEQQYKKLENQRYLKTAISGSESKSEFEYRIMVADKKIKEIDTEIALFRKIFNESQISVPTVTNDKKTTKEGDTKLIDGVMYKYKNGKWVKVNFDSGDSKKKKTDPMKLLLQQEDNFYSQELAKLRKRRNDERLTEEKYNEELRKIEFHHYEARLAIALTFEKETAASNKTRLNEIKKIEADSQNEILKVQEQADNDRLTASEKKYNENLRREAKTYDNERIINETNYAKGLISKEQFDTAMLLLDLKNGASRIDINKKYLSELHQLNLNNAYLKTDAVKKANEEILKEQQQFNKKYLEYESLTGNVLKNFRGKFNLLTPDEEMQFQKDSVEAAYLASVELLKSKKLESGDTSPVDTTQLDKAKDLALTDIVLSGEQNRAAIRRQYGIETLQSDYKLQQKMLKQQYDKGLITEKEYEQAKRIMKVQAAKQVFDQLAALAAQAVQTMQQAELDQIDAKYDVEIEAAKGNAEETERLENEKAQKKLEVEKKYADVNFAIKVSQIIADTAVAAMMAYAQLGPIAGPIAAAIVSLVGVGQIAIANAERNKIKNMTLASSAGSGTSNGGQRIVNQQAEGKYDVIGEKDGKTYRNVPYTGIAQTGIVTRPTLVGEQGSELVISSPDLRKLQKHINYPLVVQAINDARSGSVPQRADGKYDSIKTNPAVPTDKSDYSALFIELRDLLLHLKTNGIQANSYWSLTDFDKEQKRKQTAEAKFTRTF